MTTRIENVVLKPRVWRGGLPVLPDVLLLQESFPGLTPGDFISYQEIESVIESPHGSRRFQTVTNAWRAALEREHNLILKAEAGHGFCVANPGERIKLAGAKYSGGMRKVRRAGRIAQTTPSAGLSPDEAKVQEHLVRVAAAITLADRTEAKRLDFGSAINK